MNFLGQHFFTDAGIVLPENVEQTESVLVLDENISKLHVNNDVAPDHQRDEENISTVSVENIDIRNMSDEDLKELQTSTTNITDDVKVNLQKINKSKSMSKLSMETVKKRNKRYSCILPTESNLPIPVTFKRRSLGISPGEISRIPVSFRTRKHAESSNKDQISSIPVVSNKQDINLCRPLQLKHSSKRNSSFEPSNTKENTEKTAHVEKDKNSNKECINKNEVKENIPMSINVPIKAKTEKVSGLPVLTR